MIDFRYHLVSIIGIFFALAVGIVLGAGPLANTVDDNINTQVSDLRTENQRLRDELVTAEAVRSYDEQFAGAVSANLVSERLAERNVLIVALPGADEEVVTAVRDQVTAAGGNAEFGIEIADTWVTSDSAVTLDGLASDLVQGDAQLDPEVDGYRRGATVLADALLESDPASGVTVDTETLDAYAEAGLISTTGEPGNAPTLVVTVAGALPEEDAGEQAAAILAGLAAELDSASEGAVLAGAPNTATEPGVLATARNDADLADAISTVDVVNSTSGRIAVVYAVVEQRDGGQGHYGIGADVDGPIATLPPVTTSVTDEDTVQSPDTSQPEATDPPGEDGE